MKGFGGKHGCFHANRTDKAKQERIRAKYGVNKGMRSSLEGDECWGKGHPEWGVDGVLTRQVLGRHSLQQNDALISQCIQEGKITPYTGLL